MVVVVVVTKANTKKQIIQLPLPPPSPDSIFRPMVPFLQVSPLPIEAHIATGLNPNANTVSREIDRIRFAGKKVLLGKMLGCCKLSELKYFCKHTKNHKTGAKDRVLYLTYMGLCKQLDPTGPFHI
ncbi:hypothetical protein GQ457_06G007910 [Hibiscus cannabinus]